MKTRLNDNEVKEVARMHIYNAKIRKIIENTKDFAKIYQ